MENVLQAGKGARVFHREEGEGMTLWRHARKWPRAAVIGERRSAELPLNFSYHRGEKGIAIWEEEGRERIKNPKICWI